MGWRAWGEILKQKKGSEGERAQLLGNPEAESGATLLQKGRPKECDHISKGLARLGGNPREGRQEFPTVEAQKDGLLYEV